jgi:hypothetical protein
VEICLEDEVKECGNVKCEYDTVLKKSSCKCEEGEKFDKATKTCKGGYADMNGILIFDRLFFVYSRPACNQ